MKNLLHDGIAVTHYWHGALPVAFLLSVPGSAEADQLRPVAGVTGRNLGQALAHLVATLPAAFPTKDRYAYRISNAWAAPLSKALGHAHTEATRAQILPPENVARVRADLAGIALVVLCGDRAQYLEAQLADFALVRAAHTSINGLNSTWPSAERAMFDPGWMARKPSQRTAARLALWAEDVARQVAALLDAGDLPTFSR